MYKRRLSNSKGGLISHIVDDNIILASVDFSYEVSVSRSAGEVLHFGQAKPNCSPAEPLANGKISGRRPAFSLSRSNDGVENFYVDLLPRFIVDDVKNIPSR
ncbi:hypothetical protein V2K00_07475 [Pseudomonas alliivorans]|nr:hypothetical protein [Pseudomonas alliivorans]